MFDVLEAKTMNRKELVKERKRLMDILERQGDFPNKEILIAYEENKRKIIDLERNQ